MKVKDLIILLQQLDQERNIWILTNLYNFSEPNIISVTGECDCWLKENRDKVGDYYLEVL